MAPEGDLFPHSPRVIYGKAPLIQVICQVRYPQILRIDSQPPADFQDRIRQSFPLVERQKNDLSDLPPDVIQLMGLPPQGTSNFLFRTEDQKQMVNLGSDALSLTSHEYGEWPSFLRHLIPTLDALAAIYKPSFYVRVGLRYINEIQRSAIGLENHPWAELVRKEVLGELSMPHIAAAAIDAKRTLRLRVPARDGYGIYLQHGFAQRSVAPNELFYRLDFDFYRDVKTEVPDVNSILDSLNAMVGRAFRWCITETLHQRLEPREVAMAEHSG